MTNDLSIWHTAASSFFFIFFSFKSYAHIQTLTLSRIYQHYMFLHHSQTGPYLVKLQVYLAPIILKRCAITPDSCCSLNTIRFYIILKPVTLALPTFSGLNTIRFYIILKPFQSVILFLGCLNTIRFYIILKPRLRTLPSEVRLNTIRFYIILKPTGALLILAIVWIPYVFTSFSNCVNHSGSTPVVWIPYVFTSFSNFQIEIF